MEINKHSSKAQIHWVSFKTRVFSSKTSNLIAVQTGHYPRSHPIIYEPENQSNLLLMAIRKDIAVHNVWILAHTEGSHIPQFEIRWGDHPNLSYEVQGSKELGNLLHLVGAPPAHGCPTRFDLTSRATSSFPLKTRRWCAGEGCTSVGRTECNQCAVGLCLDCFAPFHIQ